MRLGHLLFVLFLTILLAACGDKIEANMSEEIQDFEFTTQDNTQLSLQDLEGKWWLADFMYTNCTLVCPSMTSNMVKVQKKLKEEDLDVQIISFSVDPNYDSPNVLKEYAIEYEADLSNWYFLTGYDFETIKDLSINSFQTMLQEGTPENENDLIAHSTSFFLINPNGELIKKYDGMGTQQVDEIIEDFKKVL